MKRALSAIGLIFAIGWCALGALPQLADAQLTLTHAGCSPGLCSGTPAIAAPVSIIGSPFSNTYSSGGNSSDVTANVPIGSLVVIDLFSVNNNDAFSGVTDNAGNSYTVYEATNSGWSTQAFAYNLSITHALVSGSTYFTATTSSAGGWFLGAVYSNVNSGVDKSFGVSTSTAATTWSQATGTLSQAHELILGSCSLGVSTYNTSPNFTSSINEPYVGLDYKIVSATTSVTYAPTWASGGYGCVLMSFKQ